MGKNRETVTIPDSGKFLCRDREFYSTFLKMLLTLALQNIITYTINVADNIMLGAYSQTALAGAAAVNQIQYILQQYTIMGLGEGLVVLAGQYFGSGDRQNHMRVIGIALICGWFSAIALTAAAVIAPTGLVSLFTDDEEVIGEAVSYISMMRWTYIIFVTTNILLAALRSMKVVKIAFRISCVALVVNVCINYTLIFGHFGAPEMGIRGAAVGTITARSLELIIVVVYILRHRKELGFSLKGVFSVGRKITGRYFRVAVPCVVSSLVFNIAGAVQTAAFGHISQDALAAQSATNTLYQYCKMVPSSAASSASVWVSSTVGSGKLDNLRQCVRTFQVMFLCIGIIMCGVLLLISFPILNLYSITDTARGYAREMIVVQSVICVGMSYQMPCGLGIIRGGGDTKYTMISDILYGYLCTVPLGLLSAFVFNWPVVAVCLCFNIDQVFKCLTVGIKVNRYGWIRKLTK